MFAGEVTLFAGKITMFVGELALPSDWHQAIVQGSGTGAQLPLSQVEEVLFGRSLGEYSHAYACNMHMYIYIYIYMYICIYVYIYICICCVYTQHV